MKGMDQTFRQQRNAWQAAGSVRRLLLGLALGALLFAVPGMAWADKVGALMPTGNIPYFLTVHKALEEELVKQGVTAEFLLQKPAPTEMSWKNATRKLVTLESKVIVAYGAGTALAAKGETQDVAIVYTGAFEPEAVGAAGRNLTGCDAKASIPTLLGHLKKIANPAQVGVLFSSDEADSVKQAEAVALQCGTVGMPAVKLDVKSMLDNIEFPATPAVLLTCSGAVQNQKALESIVAKARAGKVATASLLGGGEQGVLLTLAANPVQQGQEAARMVAAILKGTAPSAIPVNNAPKVELTINLNEAKALGFTVPFEILGTAKVIK